MFNIVKQQDELKNYPDNMLKQYMANPSGVYPPYLVMSEMQRREKMRAEFSGQQPPKTTMAEEMSGSPPAPDAGPPQNAPPQDPNAQGIMGLPNDTTAGAVMKSRISGQPQMAGNMVANPPQGMADGGPVAAPRANPFASSLAAAPQFGSPVGSPGGLFAGAGPTMQTSPSGGMPTFTQNTPPPAATNPDPLGLLNRPRGTPNPVVHQNTPNTRLNLPANMAPPKAGTAGLRTTYTGRDGQVAHYSWETPAARDAYIKSMTPVTKAGGGPIYLSGGGDFPSGPTDQFSDEDLQRAATSPDPELRITALDEMKKRNSMSMAKRLDAQLGRGGNAVLGALGNVAEFGLRAPGRVAEGALNEAQGIGSYFGGKGPQLSPSYTSERGNGQTPTPPTLAPSASAPQPNLPTTPQPAPQSASVSGNPPQPAPAAPAGGGLADLLKQTESNDPTSDYMTQIRALMEKQRGDPAALATQDKNNALMQLGLGMMGAKSRNVFGALAEGAVPALQSYVEKQAERAKNERALTTEEMAALGTGAQLSQAERHNAQANAIAIDRANRENEAAKFEREVKFPKEQETERARIAAMASRYGGQADSKEYLKAVDVIKAFALAPPGSKTDQDLLAWARGVVAQNTGAGGGPAAGTDPGLIDAMNKRGLL